jgi:hypothetical protein
MPIGLLVLLTFAIMGLRKGIDFPQCALAAAVGDHSNGTVFQEPVDMIGNFVDLVWRLVEQIWSRGETQQGLIHIAHAAQVMGVAG